MQKNHFSCPCPQSLPGLRGMNVLLALPSFMPASEDLGRCAKGQGWLYAGEQSREEERSLPSGFHPSVSAMVPGTLARHWDGRGLKVQLCAPTSDFSTQLEGGIPLLPAVAVVPVGLKENDISSQKERVEGHSKKDSNTSLLWENSSVYALAEKQGNDHGVSAQGHSRKHGSTLWSVGKESHIKLLEWVQAWGRFYYLETVEL